VAAVGPRDDRTIHHSVLGHVRSAGKQRTRASPHITDSYDVPAQAWLPHCHTLGQAGIPDPLKLAPGSIICSIPFFLSPMGITAVAIGVSGGVAHTDLPLGVLAACTAWCPRGESPVSELNRIAPSQCSDASASEPSREAAPLAERLRIVDKDTTRC
jgi:hypothetical protein